MIHSRNKIVIGVVVALLVVGILLLLKQYIGPVSVPSKEENNPINETVVQETEKIVSIPGIKVPEGFVISKYADKISGARAIVLDPRGRLIVSQTSEGKITVLENKDNKGTAETKKELASGLSKPHGMAFDCPIDDRNLPCYLYVAQRDELGRYLYDSESATVSNYEKLTSLDSAKSDRHFTRSLNFLPSPEENILLVSVGSSCDVCYEKSQMRGRIMAFDTKTKTISEYAGGLRNAVFMATDFVSGRIFATEMGRDRLGDELPPDEINIIEKGKNYGWPICYGKNVHDTNFDKNQYIQNPCNDKAPSFIDLPAHSAPLGLAFIPEEGWPEDYWYDLVVAFHGSWNRTEPTGYKIMRLKLDAQGNYEGSEDFISGWLTSKGTKLGRPVDILVLSGGTAYITDDSSGVIYKFSRKQ